MTKKRYVGLDEFGELHATGLEMRRTDWTPLAQNVQETLIKMILIDEATEDELNNYIQFVKGNVKENPIEDFIFEKIVDCRKEIKAKTRIIKAWESAGYPIKVIDYEDEGKQKKKYQCISPKGEVLLGIRWVYNNKGEPIAISEDESSLLFKEKIGYDWYIDNQIVPIAKRIFASLDYKLGKKQINLFGETVYI